MSVVGLDGDGEADQEMTTVAAEGWVSVCHVGSL